MRKQVIMFVMHELELGGAERVVSNLVNNLDRERFEIHLCLFKKKGVLIETLRDDITLYDLKASRVITSGHKLFFLILKLKPNTVFSSITHVNLLMGLFIPLLRVFTKRTKFITREVNIPSIRAKYMKKSKRLDYFYKYIIGNFDHIVAQSNYMKEDICKSYKVDENRIKVINNPLDIEFVERSILKDRDKSCFKKDDTVKLLAVGNFRMQKGFDILLESISYLDDRFHLYIIGDGAMRGELESIIRDLNISNRVTLLGFQQNPYIYMKQSDIFLLSSRYEGFPNVVLEANSCGRFVIAFEVAGVDREIIQEGINGSLVEFENKREFAKAIERESHIEHNEKDIVETTQRYRVENIIKEYEKLFII